MTYMDLAKVLAVQESMALRGYARNRMQVPPHRPIDRWAIFERQRHTSSTSFGAVA